MAWLYELQHQWVISMFGHLTFSSICVIDINVQITVMVIYTESCLLEYDSVIKYYFDDTRVLS